MSKFIANILIRENMYHSHSMSDGKIIEKLKPNNAITNSKRVTKYCFCKLKSNFSFQFRNKHKRLKDAESRCCWCIIMLNDTKLAAKILHIGRGRFKILNDEYGGRYMNETVDASDVLSCDLDDKLN